MEISLITSSPNETHALGKRLSKTLAGGENLFLVGDLGSGKTALVQGIAEGLGIREPVKSPTFTFLREYEIPLRSTRLAHFDLYRLPDAPTRQDLDSIELLERLHHPDTITVIEWADKLTPYFADQHLMIEFAILADDKRQLTLPKKLANRQVVR